MPISKRYEDRRWQAHIIGQSHLRPWLQERGSLTARLKKQYPDFAVELLAQGWRKPHYDEQVLLGLPASTRAWVREVMLTGHGQPQVFAHSVIARKDLRGPWCGLRNMGRVPLGAALFANARVQRGRLHYRKLSSKHPLQQTLSRLITLPTDEGLWTRRSLFRLRQYQLLVTEVFLPTCGRHDIH